MGMWVRRQLAQSIIKTHVRDSEGPIQIDGNAGHKIKMGLQLNNKIIWARAKSQEAHPIEVKFDPIREEMKNIATPLQR